MTQRLDEARKLFRSDLGKAQGLLDLISSLRQFGASSIPSEIGGGKVSWKESSDLWHSAKDQRIDLPILSGSLLLYVVGRFEYFVRVVVETAADEMAEKFGHFGELPNRLRSELIKQTANALLSRGRFDDEEQRKEHLILTLADNLRPESDLATINSEVISWTSSNMRPEVLKQLLNRLGLSDFWGEASKESRLRTYLETRGENETRKRATVRLTEIIEERNQIAHPTPDTNFPDTERVKERCDFLLVLGDVMVDIVAAYLVGLPAPGG